MYISIVSHPFLSSHSLLFLCALRPLLRTFTLSLYFLPSFSLSSFHSFSLSRFRPRTIARRETNLELQFPRDLSRSRHWSTVTATETFGTTASNHADNTPLCQASFPEHATVGLWLLGLGTAADISAWFGQIYLAEDSAMSDAHNGIVNSTMFRIFGYFLDFANFVC